MRAYVTACALRASPARHVNPHEETMGSTRNGNANPIGAALPQHREIAATAAAAHASVVGLS